MSKVTTTQPTPVKLWGRGQVTIPKTVRKVLKLDGESHLNVFVIGRCLILTPKRLMRASLAKDMEKSMKAHGLGLDDLLEELTVQRQRYNREQYGL